MTIAVFLVANFMATTLALVGERLAGGQWPITIMIIHVLFSVTLVLLHLNLVSTRPRGANDHN